jgi:acyl transferase domain-containing protein
MMPMATAYERALEAAKISYGPQNHSCDMFSSVNGQKMTPADISPGYFKDNMTSTVQFYQALTECLTHHSGDLVILELGPHPALEGPAKEILRCQKRMPTNYFHSLVRHRHSMEVLLENIGGLIASGVSLEKRNVNGIESINGLQCKHKCAPVLKHLPSYQWDHSTSLWYEARTSRNQRFRRFPCHQVLGSRYLEDSPLNPSWRSLLKLEDVSWLAALKVGRSPLYAVCLTDSAEEQRRNKYPCGSFYIDGC